MTPQEIQTEFKLRDAVRDMFWRHGFRLLDGREEDVLTHLRGLGVDVSLASGFLTLSQGSTGMVLFETCKTIRTQLPHLFVTDPRFDEISSLEDFHGSSLEILKAKSAFISKHGSEAFSKLPATKAEAERRNAVPDASMDRASFLALDWRERSKLAGIIGASGIARIMARTR